MPKIQVGKLIPAFTGITTSGKIKSAQWRGENLVLFFYPRDNTPGCTSENIAFSQAHKEFSHCNTEVVGVSRDSIASHEGFIRKHKLTVSLISDIDETLCTLFDVIKEKKMYGKASLGIERSTFLVDAQGILRQEWRKVKVSGHVDEVLAAARSL